MRLFKNIIILFLLSPVVAIAQNAKISGKIYDESTHEPVAFAQVALYEKGGKEAISGGLTDEEGNFSLQAKTGEYDLAVVFVGYERKVVSDVDLADNNKNLGVIMLTPSTKQLDEVVVKAQEIKRPITTDLEGMNVRPDQTISNVGGSLLDVLRNVPSVNVDQDGNVTIRGSGSTNILIDGRNSALATDLEQIPASAVKNIKIINNPNAKYDAEGTGGVVNIQLKKGGDTGTNGHAEVTVGTKLRLNSSLRLNHMAEKYNVYGGYSIRRWPRAGHSWTVRDTYDNNERLRQDENSERKDLEHTFNLGGDLFLGKNKLSYEGAANLEDETDKENRNSSLYNLDTDELLLKYTRINTENEDNHSFDNALIFQHLYDDPEKELRAVVSHSIRSQYETQKIDVYSNSSETETGLERSANDESRMNAIIQVDFVHPLWGGKLEAGYKSNFRAFDNDYDYEILNENTGDWVNQDNVSNRFLYKDQIHALYLIHSRSFGKFDVALGVRAEQTNVDTKLYDTNEKNEQNYIDFFPSFQTLYKLGDKNSLKFTYSRRIDRPNGWRLNPFPDVSDSLNIRMGNPDLQPEYIHSLEFGNLFSTKNLDLTTNIFYRHVDGLVDYLVDVEDGISYRMPQNLNTSDAYGLEVIGVSQIFPWWNINASYSLFRIEVDGTNLSADYTHKGISSNAKLTTDFNLPYDVDLQLTGNYVSPDIEAQGRDDARYHMDMSIQRSFLDDKAKVSLSLRDVFNTRRFSGVNETDEFRQVFEYKRESRILLLSLSYSI